MLGGMISLPVILAPAFCIQHDEVAKTQLLNTMLFVSGMVTLLQAGLGTRYLSMCYLLKPSSLLKVMEKDNLGEMSYALCKEHNIDLDGHFQTFHTSGREGPPSTHV